MQKLECKFQGLKCLDDRPVGQHTFMDAFPPDTYKAVSKENLGKRFDWLDKQLAGKQYLMGDKFTIADAYLFTVLRWTARIEMDLAKWPNLKAYVDRVAARPKVQEALK